MARWTVAPVFALMVAACASTPDREAIEAVSAARASIEQAERADAGAHSAEALRDARRKTEAASAELDDGDEDQAIRLAEEARADAAYAAANARRENTRIAAQEIEETVRALRAEAERLSVGFEAEQL